MNKTISIFALLAAAVLVVGTLAVTPAFATNRGFGSGNTIISQRIDQSAHVSGFFNHVTQDARNIICVNCHK
jgi:hypothetical protein